MGGFDILFEFLPFDVSKPELDFGGEDIKFVVVFVFVNKLACHRLQLFLTPEVIQGPDGTVERVRCDSILREVVNRLLIPGQREFKRRHCLFGAFLILGGLPLGGAEFVVSLANLIGAVRDKVGFLFVLVDDAFVSDGCLAPSFQSEMAIGDTEFGFGDEIALWVFL